MILSALIALAAQATQPLVVDHYPDDGQAGTLRWAIERSNAEPGRYRIEIVATGPGPLEIRPARPLPAIRGPVSIEGMARRADGRLIAIDGSAYIWHASKSCPGANPAQFGTNVRTLTSPGLALVDTTGVEISGLEIRNFCIGILVLRSSGSSIHDNRISNNIGGAGVMFTGDDGAGGMTGLTADNRLQRNVLTGNGDGAELTRGATRNLIADNVFEAGTGNLEPSQGIEILRGHDNVLIGNVFADYSDGVQINGGNGNLLFENTFRGNAFGISVTGDGNVIDRNTIAGNNAGIVLRVEPQPGRTRITRNRISGNGQPIRRCVVGGTCDPGFRGGAIVLGRQADEPVPFGVTTPPPMEIGARERPSAPVLERIIWEMLSGQVTAQPGSAVTIELFGNPESSDEASVYLGSVPVIAGGDGVGRFTFGPSGRYGSFTATATTAQGETSLLSAALRR